MKPLERGDYAHLNRLPPDQSAALNDLKGQLGTVMMQVGDLVTLTFMARDGAVTVPRHCLDALDEDSTAPRLYLVSGRRHGDDDDAAALIEVSGDQDPTDCFLAEYLGLTEADLADHTDDSPVYFIITCDDVSDRAVDFAKRVAEAS